MFGQFKACNVLLTTNKKDIDRQKNGGINCGEICKTMFKS